MLAHVLGKSREWVLSHPEKTVNKIQILKYKYLIKKRARGIPLAYLTKHKEFFGLDFFVNKNVLIPRPDTETLVTLALEHLSTKAQDKITLIDVGTGSGCIPISIIKTLKHSAQGGSALGGKNIKTFAIDISRRALRVAKINAKKHAVKINFLHGNLLSPFINLIPKLPKTYNLVITANLPYITKEQFAAEPSIHHEPRLALVAEESGLALYHKLLKQISLLVTSYKLQVTSFFEIDPSQSQSITKLIKSILPTAEIEIKKDLAGLDRIVIVKNS